jgi:hypothetical protein
MPETVARGMDLLKVLSIGDKSPFHSSTLGQSSFPYAHLWERHENGPTKLGLRLRLHALDAPVQGFTRWPFRALPSESA